LPRDGKSEPERRGCARRRALLSLIVCLYWAKIKIIQKPESGLKPLLLGMERGLVPQNRPARRGLAKYKWPQSPLSWNPGLFPEPQNFHLLESLLIVVDRLKLLESLLMPRATPEK
jgi:hypothetical protein